MSKKCDSIRVIMLEEFCNFFKNNPTEQTWRGTASQLFRLVFSNPLNDRILRGADNLTIYGILHDMYRERLIPLDSVNGVWSVTRAELEKILRAQNAADKILAAVNEPQPTASHFSERELLAIMSAVIFAGSGSSTYNRSFKETVKNAKELLNEIDSTPA